MGSIGKSFTLVLCVILAIAMLLTCESKDIVNTQTINKDFGVTNLFDYKGDKYCSFDVSIEIQSEADGNWVVNHTYLIQWSFKITYVNETMYKIGDFSIVFYNRVDPIVTNSSPDKAVLFNFTNDETIVSNQSIGNLSTTLIPTASPLNIQINSQFPYTVEYRYLEFYNENSSQAVTSGTWNQSADNQPIYINVENGQPLTPKPTYPSIIQQLIYPYSVVIAILIVAIILLLLYRRHRKTANLNK